MSSRPLAIGAAGRLTEHATPAVLERERVASCRGRSAGLRAGIAAATARRDRLAVQIRQADEAAALRRQLQGTRAALARTPLDLGE